LDVVVLSPGDISATDVSDVSVTAEATEVNPTIAPTNPTFDPVPTEVVNETGPSSQFGGDFPTSVFGGEATHETPGSPSTPGEPRGTPGIPAEPGDAPPPSGPPPLGGPLSPRRAQIHAVIVSNLSDPSQVLSGNVNLTGGIIALGPPTPSRKPRALGSQCPNYT
jgi:hypothetical protein